MTNYGFEVTGLARSRPDNDELFGVWRLRPEAAGVSFSVGEPLAPTWRINLPGDAQAAYMILDQQRQAIDHSRKSLDNAAQRLSAIGAPRTGAGVSFAATPGPEAGLLSRLNQIETVSSKNGAAISYSLFDRADAAELETSNQWRQLLAQAQDVITHAARVETAIAAAEDGCDRLIGQTAISWTGDFQTLWRADLDGEQRALHQRSVQLVLSSRAGWLRLIGVVGTGAANIAVKLALPGGQLLALPAVWTFVKDVLKEWRELQTAARVE